MAPTLQALSDFDVYLLAEGTFDHAYEKLGAHLAERDGRQGVQFAVWAPNAKQVSVVGDFNQWNPGVNMMRSSAAGVWESFIPGLAQGAVYKYHVISNYRGYTVDKTDPFGFAAEVRPHTASRVWNLGNYSWNDGSWMTST